MADDPKNTPDPSADLEKKFADIANAAVSSHIKRFEKSFSESFTKLLDERFASIPKQEPAKQQDEPKGKSKEDPELTAYKTKLDEALKRLDNETKAREKAEIARRDESAFTRVKSLLGNVRPELQEAAAKLLFHVDKRVSYDETGNPLFKIRRAPAPGMAEEDMELPLEVGVDHWLKSKDAAAFLPAPEPTGRGGLGRNPSPTSPSKRGPGGRPTYDKPATSDDEKVRRAMEMEQWLIDQQRAKGA